MSAAHFSNAAPANPAETFLISSFIKSFSLPIDEQFLKFLVRDRLVNQNLAFLLKHFRHFIGHRDLRRIREGFLSPFDFTKMATA